MSQTPCRTTPVNSKAAYIVLPAEIQYSEFNRVCSLYLRSLAVLQAFHFFPGAARSRDENKERADCTPTSTNYAHQARRGKAGNGWLPSQQLTTPNKKWHPRGMGMNQTQQARHHQPHEEHKPTNQPSKNKKAGLLHALNSNRNNS